MHAKSTEKCCRLPGCQNSAISVIYSRENYKLSANIDGATFSYEFCSWVMLRLNPGLSLAQLSPTFHYTVICFTIIASPSHISPIVSSVLLVFIVTCHRNSL